MTASATNPPFDAARLDALMEEAGLDAVLATSKHSIRYLLGGYRFFLYAHGDAHGISRYLPMFLYPRGAPERASYVGTVTERQEAELGRIWAPRTHFANRVVADYARSAVEALRALGRPVRRLGVEMDFLPHPAFAILGDGLPETEIVNANLTLELLRAVKTPAELALLREASEKVEQAMVATFARHAPGATKTEILATLREEEIARGLEFEYALINIGTDFNRAPSDQRWRAGEVLALDSGGNYHGYIGDLCRMGYPGEPDAELVDLLARVEEIQRAAFRPIRAGVPGGEIYAAAMAAVAASPERAALHFVAHGMGLVGHEAPWLSDKAPLPYPAYHADRPLEAGMIISVETTLPHPRRGFIKLEDTIAVTAGGWEGFGWSARGWNSRG